jgi:hypothetical protein
MQINDTQKIYIFSFRFDGEDKTLQTSASNLWHKEIALCTHNNAGNILYYSKCKGGNDSNI